jgi:hypothetical protein
MPFSWLGLTFPKVCLRLNRETAEVIFELA